MDHYSFAVFPDEDLLDLRPFQYGWEQCAPLHSFGPYVRNHYLFHYVISGRGFLDSNSMDSTSQHYDLEAGQGFLICPGLVTPDSTPSGIGSSDMLHVAPDGDVGVDMCVGRMYVRPYFVLDSSVLISAAG